jgi:hypothetical protein
MLKTDKFKPFLLIAGFILLFFLVTPNANAQGKVNICNPPQTFFGKIRDFFKKDIRETTVNHLTSVASDFTFNMATGTEMGGWMGCTGYAAESASCLQDSTLRDATACTETDPEICEGIYNQYINTGQNAVEFSSNFSDPLAYRNSATAGSMLGLGTSLDNYMHNEPIPINFAYFFQDYAQRIPLVNQTAFAQTTYAQPLVGEVMVVWKLMRNLAYGLMAIVIMVVGLLIITRRKINQQIVVTVQYALPKIVIAMILITFSYPIGAAVASFSWALYNSGNEIVASLGGYSGLDCGQEVIDVGLGAAVLVTGVIAVMVLTGVGMFVTVFLIVLAIAIIVAWLMLIVKAFIVYLKMLIHVVISPLYFVIGAIPGNDGQITNWFKKLAVYGISLFLMGLAQPLVILVASQLLFATTPEEAGWTGVFYLIMAAPIAAIFGFIIALKIPNMVENTIMGNKRR